MPDRVEGRVVVLRELARHYVRMGWYVFPCEVDGKRPATRSGFKAATGSDDQVASWWHRTPYNIGIWTGQSRLVVLDCDVKVGVKRWRPDEFEPYTDVPDHDVPIVSGLATWLGLLADRGMDWIPTYTVLTPSLGVHFYFTYDGEDIHPAVAWRHGLDIRAGGSYVVAAGSMVDDRRYELCTEDSWADFTSTPQPLPEWLRVLLEQETTPGALNHSHEVTPGKYSDVVRKLREDS